MASFYFMGTILIRCNIYATIFKLKLIKSTLGLELGLRVRVFADVYCVISYDYYTVQLYWNGLQPYYNCPGW